MSSKQAPIKGVCHVQITLNNKQYKNICLKVLENLSGDVLLGFDFQKQPAAVTFLHGGTKLELKINEAGNEVCSLTASKLRVLWLFANLKPYVQPIATKSQAYSNEDQQFTGEEIKHRLAEGKCGTKLILLVSARSYSEGGIWSP